MTHLDLFSGIGGFSLAFDNIFHEQKNKHIFVEWDDFCKEVLRKHWPEAEIHGDIDKFIADTKSKRDGSPDTRASTRQGEKLGNGVGETFVLTGGFPCQPFSQAGRRQGTSDDRYKWPSMLECVSLFRPEWVVAENVAGIASWNDGLVLETVCSDLEKEGYEVQPFIIPACAVQAPHRRDRIWFVAQDTKCERARGWGEGGGQILERQSTETKTSRSNSQSGTSNTKRSRHEGDEYKTGQSARHSRRTQWDTHWFEVASELCRVDDGIPRRLDRNSRLKALGNAIVPQVAEEIFEAIKLSTLLTKE